MIRKGEIFDPKIHRERRKVPPTHIAKATNVLTSEEIRLFRMRPDLFQKYILGNIRRASGRKEIEKRVMLPFAVPETKRSFVLLEDLRKNKHAYSQRKKPKKK